MKFILPILMVVMLLLFPQRVYCASYVEVSFIEYDVYGEYSFQRSSIPITEPDIHIQISTALNYLFALDRASIHSYPTGTRLVESHLLNDCLTIFLYIPQGSYGGTMLERIYLGQILKTLLDLEGVNRVSIMADTPEGLNISEESSWKEFFYGIVEIY